MALDLAPLEKALARLRDALARHQNGPADEQLRDGLIKRFEYTYELSHRTMRRFLAETAPSAEAIAALSFADLIRAGSAEGLTLGDWPAWREFRDMRNRTTHTYDEYIADTLVAAIPGFVEEVAFLLEQLKRRSR